MSFKIQFILESLAKKDLGFTFNLAHNSNNKVTSIVRMTYNMSDNFERFGNYMSIYVIHSSIRNTKEFCYIALVIKNEIGTINVVCEGFVSRKIMILIYLFWIHCSICALFEEIIRFVLYFLINLLLNQYLIR